MTSCRVLVHVCDDVMPYIRALYLYLMTSCRMLAHICFRLYSDFLFFTGYKGLTVKEFSGLRDKLHDSGAKCVVLKNTYIKLGLKEAGVELPEDFQMTGDTLCVLGKEDPCAPAKVLKEESKEYFSQTTQHLTFRKQNL